jgi:ATP synthase protein I
VVREAAPLLGIGTTLAVTVLAGVAAGFWLDGWCGTTPWMTLLCAMGGIGVALYGFFKTVRRR